MAGFDDLIRGTLEKQGNPNAQQRASIYQSSRQALERMLERNASIDEATALAQRQRLEQAISNIEASYVAKEAAVPPPAAPSIPTPAPQPELKPQPEQVPEPAAPQPEQVPEPAAPQPIPAAVEPVETPAPQVQAAVVPQVAPQPSDPAAAVDPAAAPLNVEQPSHLEPQISEEPGAGRVKDYPEIYKGDAFERRKPYAKLLLWTIIIVGLVVGIVWAVTLGPAFLKQQFDGSVPNPASKIESGSFIPEGSDAWISAFDPSADGHNIVSAERGKADLIRSGDTMFVRLASNTGSEQGNIRIVMPKGVMQALKGRSATFELMIKNASDTAHQFAIFCEFGALGNCGRKRFTANNNIEAFIFDALINDADLPAGQDAFLDINSDLSNGGKPIEVYSIRVRAG